MAARPQALDHQGDYLKHPSFAAFTEVSEQAWSFFHVVMGGHEKRDDGDRDYLMTRLTYIAEITSTAVRHNASWALTHAAMSLTRDRYEQVVRFSWLARQKDDSEINKFFAYYHARANKIFRALKEAAGDSFAHMLDNPPEWTTRPFTKMKKRSSALGTTSICFQWRRSVMVCHRSEAAP